MRHLKVGLAVCAPPNDCAPIAGLPPKVAAITQTGPGRYLASTKDASFEVDAKTGAVSELADAGPEVVMRLEDGSLLRYEHLAARTRVFRRASNASWTLLDYEKWRAYEFRFLANGLHLFKDSPGMGGQESPYFIDLVLGHPTHLYVVDGLGKKPRRVHTSSQQMDADFFDGGRRVAWWQPGHVNEQEQTRTLGLQVLDVASGAITEVDAVTMGLGRQAPETSSSLRSTWIVHAHGYGLRAEDVATHKRVERALASGEYWLPGVPHNSAYTQHHSRRWSEHIVLGRRLADMTELEVRALPSFTLVLRARVPTHGLREAEWVEDE